jgi:hypothetical protein
MSRNQQPLIPIPDPETLTDFLCASEQKVSLVMPVQKDFAILPGVWG